MTPMAWAAALAAVALALGLLACAWHRRRAISALAFDLHPPPVPARVLDAVREAEARHYAGVGAVRRRLETLQDAAAAWLPDLVALADWSVGPYRVRPSTIAPLLPWARAQGWFVPRGPRALSVRAALAHFAVRRSTGAWQAAVLLEHLSTRHPALRGLDWQAIATDPQRVALLYSGYLGAGGDWAGWRATPKPGAEALRRMPPQRPAP